MYESMLSCSIGIPERVGAFLKNSNRVPNEVNFLRIIYTESLMLCSLITKPATSGANYLLIVSYLSGGGNSIVLQGFRYFSVFLFRA